MGALGWICLFSKYCYTKHRHKFKYLTGFECGFSCRFLCNPAFVFITFRDMYFYKIFSSFPSISNISSCRGWEVFASIVSQLNFCQLQTMQQLPQRCTGRKRIKNWMNGTQNYVTVMTLKCVINTLHRNKSRWEKWPMECLHPTHAHTCTTTKKSLGAPWHRSPNLHQSSKMPQGTESLSWDVPDNQPVQEKLDFVSGWALLWMFLHPPFQGHDPHKTLGMPFPVSRQTRTSQLKYDSLLLFKEYSKESFLVLVLV